MPGQLQVYEAGVSKGRFGTYVAGDTLRVAVVGGVVKYSKNGTVVYTSTKAPIYPLLVDTALYNTGATLNNAVVSSATTPPPPPPATAVAVVWTSAAGVTVKRELADEDGDDGVGQCGRDLDAADRVGRRLRGVHGLGDDHLPDAGTVERELEQLV